MGDTADLQSSLGSILSGNGLDQADQLLRDWTPEQCLKTLGTENLESTALAYTVCR